eukprot:1950650-Pleurochrysis_carterae.AAC.2
MRRRSTAYSATLSSKRTTTRLPPPRSRGRRGGRQRSEPARGEGGHRESERLCSQSRVMQARERAKVSRGEEVRYTCTRQRVNGEKEDERERAVQMAKGNSREVEDQGNKHAPNERVNEGREREIDSDRNTEAQGEIK